MAWARVRDGDGTIASTRVGCAPQPFAGSLRLGFLLFRHLGRLPTNGLPFAVALEERAGVEVVCDLRLLSFAGGSDQTKSDDGRGAVLLNANVFRAVDRRL